MKYLLACSILAFPLIAIGATNHYFFYDSSPKYQLELTSDNTNQAPFSVTCLLMGTQGKKAVWEANIGYETVDYSNISPGYTYTIPVKSIIHSVWIGTDVEPIEANAKNIIVSYKSGGLKEMRLEVSNGVVTEVAKCGSVNIFSEPKAKQIIHQDNSDISF